MAKNPCAQIVGENIVRHASGSGMSFKQLATAMNVQEETLRKWITGERMITVYGLVRASKELGTTMEQLTNGIN